MKTLNPDILSEAIERLKREFEPEEIYLFGSHAWGTPDEDSDVDLLVIVPTSEEPPIRRSQRAHRCLRGLRMPKDVLVETRGELERVRHFRSSLENVILNKGRKLHG